MKYKTYTCPEEHVENKVNLKKEKESELKKEKENEEKGNTRNHEIQNRKSYMYAMAVKQQNKEAFTR